MNWQKYFDAALLKHFKPYHYNIMANYYYASQISLFLHEDINSILGKLVAHHPFKLDELQRNAWIEEINILKREISGFCTVI